MRGTPVWCVCGTIRCGAGAQSTVESFELQPVILRSWSPMCTAYVLDWCRLRSNRPAQVVSLAPLPSIKTGQLIKNASAPSPSPSQDRRQRTPPPLFDRHPPSQPSDRFHKPADFRSSTRASAKQDPSSTATFIYPQEPVRQQQEQNGAARPPASARSRQAKALSTQRGPARSHLCVRCRAYTAHTQAAKNERHESNKQRGRLEICPP